MLLKLTGNLHVFGWGAWGGYSAKAETGGSDPKTAPNSLFPQVYFLFGPGNLFSPILF